MYLGATAGTFVAFFDVEDADVLAQLLVEHSGIAFGGLAGDYKFCLLLLLLSYDGSISLAWFLVDIWEFILVILFLSRLFLRMALVRWEIRFLFYIQAQRYFLVFEAVREC